MEYYDKGMAGASSSVLLGRLLRDLRRSKGLTGGQLGELIGLSQSKVSKIEHGQAPWPSAETVEKMLNILDVGGEIRQQALLYVTQLSTGEGNSIRYTYDFKLDTHLKNEKQAQSIYVFTNNCIPTLLRTVAYHQAHLRTFGLTKEIEEAAVKEMLARQDYILHFNKSHILLLQESALYALVDTIDIQVTQLDRVERLINMPSLEIGILPRTASLPLLNVTNFILYDQKILFREMGTGEIEITAPDLITSHLQAFADLRQKAYLQQDAVKLVRGAIDYFMHANT